MLTVGEDALALVVYPRLIDLCTDLSRCQLHSLDRAPLVGGVNFAPEVVLSHDHLGVVQPEGLRLRYVPAVRPVEDMVGAKAWAVGGVLDLSHVTLIRIRRSQRRIVTPTDGVRDPRCQRRHGGSLPDPPTERHGRRARILVHLPRARLQACATAASIKIVTDVFARQVVLDAPGLDGVLLGDNHFDLAPGRGRLVTVPTGSARSGCGPTTPTR